MPRDPDQPEYEVGYGKPPRHTRFQAGLFRQSAWPAKGCEKPVDPGP